MTSASRPHNNEAVYMEPRKKNNVIADQFADQVHAAIADNDMKSMPDTGPYAAAAARTIDVSRLPAQLRDSASKLLQSWAKRHDVDRPCELD